jgi:tetratricopeptide (TPR) repeat protein
MLRILLTSLIAVVMWAAVLAAGAGGTIRMVSTGDGVPRPSARMSPVERTMFADARDGRFDRMDLIQAALVASGTTDTFQLARYQEQFSQFAAKLRPRIQRIGDPDSRAEALFSALHKDLLDGRYLAAQSDIAITLERGDYNCLSSVILYVALARSCEVDVYPAVLPGHIIAVLSKPDGVKPVETTYARWFVAVRAGRVDHVAVPGAANVAAYDRRQARRLTEPELIALVYYNQGYEHLMQNRFAAAWSANQKALALDPDSDRSRENFLATINNWSLALCERSEFATAQRLVAQGLEVAPDYAPLRANNRHVHRRWAERLAADGQWQAAANLLRRAARDWPDEPFFASYLRRLNQHVPGAG